MGIAPVRISGEVLNGRRCLDLRTELRDSARPCFVLYYTLCSVDVRYLLRLWWGGFPDFSAHREIVFCLPLDTRNRHAGDKIRIIRILKWTRIA